MGDVRYGLRLLVCAPPGFALVLAAAVTGLTAAAAYLPPGARPR